MKIYPKITKHLLLEEIGQEQIMSKYSNIDISTIVECIDKSKLICSPLRIDNTPTVGFYIDHKSGVLRMNDFAGYFHGDCFDVAAYVYLLDTRNSQNFAILLERIAKDFKIGIYSEDSTFLTREKDKINKLTQTKPPTVIDITERFWSYVDEKYWIKRYKLTEQDLIDNNVYLVYEAFINKQLIYSFNDKDPCYAYFKGFINDVAQYQLYFPLRNKGSFRFLGNSKRMFGITEITKQPYGIITKAAKDVIIYRKIKQPAISLVAEGVLPNPTQISHINTHWETTFVNTDFDYVGVKTANKLRKLYNYQPTFFTNRFTFFGFPNYQAKDAADFVERYGYNALLELVEWFAYEGINYNHEFHHLINPYHNE